MTNNTNENRENESRNTKAMLRAYLDDLLEDFAKRQDRSAIAQATGKAIPPKDGDQ